MSEGKIILRITVDTKKFERQLRGVFKLRLRFALFLVDIAEKIGRVKINYSIKEDKAL